MKFIQKSSQKYAPGVTRTRSYFCLFPKSFTVIDRNTNERKKITYWLERIEILEEFRKGFQSYHWRSVKVNGLVID